MADATPTRRTRPRGQLARWAPLLLAVTGVAVGVGAATGRDAAAAPWDAEGLTAFHGSVAAVDLVQARPPFTHANHGTVDCVTCHTGTDGHGSLSVTTIQDCRGCHHTEPLSRSCARCHAAADAPDASFSVVRAVEFSVGARDPQRELTFPHGEHSGIDCARCHTQGSALAVAANLDCSSCHQDHHTPQSDCASCHVAAPVSAHPPSEAHVTCSGAACHQRVPFESVPRTRAFCLGCHQDLREHEAPTACAECHSLPAPRPQAGGGG
jgi:hypothetical protein